ncbi:MAG TPA: flagellar hook-basal body complex protein FliE [Conexibacter sp.]|nr:flagellar hook-basal body complex protein FliE [Conexibacter sp.]
MTIPPINPSAVLGGDWQIPNVADAPVAPADGGGFGAMLSQQVGKLSELQDTAAAASQSLADGTATDASSVVVAVEKAQLAMQLAGQIRTKGAEAINDIFHTQI